MPAIIPKKACGSIQHSHRGHPFELIQQFQNILPPKGSLFGVIGKLAIAIVLRPDKMNLRNVCLVEEFMHVFLEEEPHSEILSPKLLSPLHP